MENEQITVALTVAQWQAILNTFNHTPYGAVTAIGDILNSLQSQTGAQLAELQQKYAAENAPSAEAGN